MASSSQQLHFVLFPLMSPGHMIPMVDIGKLLAKHGIITTIVTTPHNAKRFAATLARARESGLQIQFMEVEIPSEEAGLLKDCENFDMLPSLGLGLKFFIACNMLQDPVERLFGELKPRPVCIISDMSLAYTSQVADKFGIPRISFAGISCFIYLCLHKIAVSGILEGITSDSERFVVPGVPHHIELTKNQHPSVTMQNSEELSNKLVAAEMASYGIIVNTFEELEGEYVQEYKNVKQGKVWCVGPASLCNKEDLDKAHRGNKSSVDESIYLKWLDSQQPKSVIYACLGSICNLIPSQLVELGLGLEASRKPFIWVIRSGENSKELEKWIEEYNFEERTKGRGLLIRGWAPQVLILSHTSIGGFLTHCGWNSTLEGICAGVPMATWPLFGDQFFNEKLVVEVLGIGVKVVGAEVSVRWGEEEKIGVLVKRDDVKRAIDGLMEDGEERRRRAEELSRVAKDAIEENGSSYRNMKLLIQDIVQHQTRVSE